MLLCDWCNATQGLRIIVFLERIYEYVYYQEGKGSLALRRPQSPAASVVRGTRDSQTTIIKVQRTAHRHSYMRQGQEISVDCEVAEAFRGWLAAARRGPIEAALRDSHSG